MTKLFVYLHYRNECYDKNEILTYRSKKIVADEKVFVMDCDSNVSFDGFVERWRNHENHIELQLI